MAVDLFFLPLEHEAGVPLMRAQQSESAPEVSESAADRPPPPASPGAAFEGAADYVSAMQAYQAARSQKRRRQRRQAKAAGAAERGAWRTRQEQLRQSRREVRARRQAEDAAWRARRAASKPGPEEWVARRQCCQARADGNARWHATLAGLYREAEGLKLATPPPAADELHAVLLPIDAGSRQIASLPIIPGGRQATASDTAAALEPLLSPGLLFVLSDNGSVFIGAPVEKMLAERQVAHVRTAPHRPRTNGIAERAVQTLKGLLERETWHSLEELTAILQRICFTYNYSRPHQALGGLPPALWAQRQAALHSTPS